MFMDLLRVVLLCTRFVSSAWNWILKSKNFLGIFVDYRYLYYLSYAILLPWKLAKSALGLQGVSSIDLGALEFRVSWDSWFWISNNIFQLLGQIIGPRQCLHPTWTFINGTFGIVFSFFWVFLFAKWMLCWTYLPQVAICDVDSGILVVPRHVSVGFDALAHLIYVLSAR